MSRCCRQGDAEIDTGKVDSTMKIEEYDAETQGAIRKIMVSAAFMNRHVALSVVWEAPLIPTPCLR
jgi:hypothetical protein